MAASAHLARAVALEESRHAQAEANIWAAWEDGRISEHDRDERIARREQGLRNRLAFLRGESRPTQRQPQPLDDPNAGTVA